MGASNAEATLRRWGRGRSPLSDVGVCESLDEAETVEAVFSQARNAEATAEELLVDDGWKLVEIEPETIGVNGNGHHGNGHRDAIAIGPTVELVVGGSNAANGNGHAPVLVNGNGTNGLP